MSQQVVGVGAVANDGTGDTLRAGGQKINADLTELYSNYTQTVFAGSSAFVGTVEQRITLAQASAIALGLSYVLIPASMYPYDESLVPSSSVVKRVPEGGSYVNYDPRAYGGKNSGPWGAITSVLANLPAAGGIVDCRCYTGAQQATADVFANVTSEKPIKLIFGPSTWTCVQGNSAVIGNLFGSNIEIELNETTFILNNGQTQSFMWNTDTTAGSSVTSSVTNGSNAITIGVTTRGVTPQVGKVVVIFGHVPSSGRDNTTLNGAILSTDVTITLTSVVGQINPNGYVLIDSEIVQYSGISGNQLTGCVRGASGTAAVGHSNGATVDRVVYDNYIIRQVTGSAAPWAVVLDRPVTCVTQTNNATTIMGPHNCQFNGTGIMDGGVPPGQPDTSANGIAIIAFGSQGLKVGRGLRFQNWDHCGVLTIQSQNPVVDGSYVNCGHPANQIGFSVLFFQGSKHCTAYGDYEHVNIPCSSDDRTTQPTYYDNLCDDIRLFPRSIRAVWRGPSFEGTSRGFGLIPYVDGWNTEGSTGGGAVVVSQPQWVTAPGTNCTDNYFELGWANPVAGALSLASGAGNTRMVTYAEGITAGTVLSTNAAGWTVEQNWHPVQFNGLPGAISVNTPPAYNVGIFNKYNVSSVGGANFGYGLLADVGGDTGITSNIRALGARVEVLGGANLNTAYGLFVLNPAIVSGTLSQAVGIWVDPQTAGTVNNNWAIRTNAGKVQLGDAVYVGVGALAAPVATQYRVPAVLFQTANLTTTSTVDASIASFSLLGTSLASTGQAVRIRAAGREVTQAGSFNIKFGATVLFTITPAAGAAWSVDVTVTRSGATTQLANGCTINAGTVASVGVQPAETLSGNITIDFRGSVTAGGTLALDYATVTYESAA